MLKKVLTGTGIAALLVAALLVGSLTLGSAFAKGTHSQTNNQSTIVSQNKDVNEVKANGLDLDDVEEQEGDQSEAVVPPGHIDDGAELLPQASITLDQAIAAAQKAESGAVGEVDLEMYQGQLVFNVDIGDKDVKVDASNGNILGWIQDDNNENESTDNEAAALNSQVVISAADAEAAALAANPGTAAVKVELDNENGVVVYSVELSNGLDVKVDAATGKILNTEADEPDRQDESQEQQNDED